MSRRLAALSVLALLAVMLPATAARAAIVLNPGSVTLRTLGSGGQPDARAGAHPDRLVLSFQVEQSGEEEEPKSLMVEFPPGLSGNSDATPSCPRAVIQDIFGGETCPADTQVGNFISGESTEPIYNLVPGTEEVVSFGVPLLSPLIFSGRLRPTDQGLTLSIARIEAFKSFGVEFNGGTIELWGVPADHQEGAEPIPARPLLTTPTRCGAPLTSQLVLRTWQNPETPVTGAAETGLPLTGCDELPFQPSFGFTLDTPAADSPSGTRIEVTMPAPSENPEVRAQSQIEGIALQFPPGMTVALGAIAGIEPCTDAQFGLGTATDPQCPPGSRVGSVEMEVPSLAKNLDGSVYLGQEHPGDRFRLFIAASGAGSTVKFIGSLRTNAAGGGISAVLQPLPQASFTRMTLRLEGGPGALLATPLACGPATAAATLTPYSGTAPVRASAQVSVATTTGGGCAGGKLPFSPRLTGGSTDRQAGHFTGFTTTVRRADGEGLPSRVEVPLPEGMSANLGAVPLCSAKAASAGTCSDASRIGSAVAELGPGTTPATVTGGIYLTGPYRQAPYGLAIDFEGKVGPYDLGEIAVRAALRIDPLTSRVEVVTDPLPTSVEGIPVRFREIGLDLDRKGFLRNPTGCAARKLSATFRSAEGVTAKASTPFAITGCVNLPFNPRFALALEGRSQLHAEGRPGLSIAAKLPAGEANLLSSKFSLPSLVHFTAKGALELCSQGAAEEGHCGKNARIGTVEGRTPLLKRPMKGYVYSVQPKGNGLPAIWAYLRSGGIRVEMRGTTKTEHGHAVATLNGIPDFPLSHFQMKLRGGKHGVVSLAGSPCGHDLRAALQVTGHNAAERRFGVRVAAPCRRHG